MLITKKFLLESSHVLPNHPGKCSRLHGHSWKVIVGIEGRVNEATGFVTDYAELSSLIEPLIAVLDHSFLNYYMPQPSAERIAAMIGGILEPLADVTRPGHFRAVFVQVCETAKTTAEWHTASDPFAATMAVRVLAEALQYCSGFILEQGPHERVEIDEATLSTVRMRFTIVVDDIRRKIVDILSHRPPQL